MIIVLKSTATQEEKAKLQAKLIEVKNNLPSYSSEGISTHTIPIEEIMVQFNENEKMKVIYFYNFLFDKIKISLGELKDIQEMLGHSDISTTQMYAKMSKNSVRESYKKAFPR